MGADTQRGISYEAVRTQVLTHARARYGRERDGVSVGVGGLFETEGVRRQGQSVGLLSEWLAAAYRCSRLLLKRHWLRWAFLFTEKGCAGLWLWPSLPTETLKWLSSLPILMPQKSFWWWQRSDRYIISLPPPPYPLHPPLTVPNKPYGFSLWTLSTVFTYLRARVTDRTDEKTSDDWTQFTSCHDRKGDNARYTENTAA